MPSSRSFSRRAVVGLMVAGLGALALGALTGCSSTDVDVYVPVITTVRSPSQEVLSTTIRILDERGNALETQVETAGGTEVATATFDSFGVPIPSNQSAPEVTYNDKGQPTAIVFRNEQGGISESWHYSYYDVRGRVSEITYEGASNSYSMTFDRDGWPLSGEIATSAAHHSLSFVYEIDLNGAVTRQNILFDQSEEPALWYTYTYEETNGTALVATRTANDGAITSYDYELVEDPSPFAMVQALLHAPDYAQLIATASAI